MGFKEERLEHSDESNKDAVDQASVKETGRSSGEKGPKGWLSVRGGDVWFSPRQEGRTLRGAKARLLGQVGVTGHALERPKGDV